MNELKIFSSNEFGEIRTAVVNNEPMFCLTDICKALGLEQPSRVKDRLNQDGVTTSKVIDKLGREQTATFINESNLYKVIFQSKKQSAEKFTEWVTNEVLPSIRKHGAYMTEDTLEKALTSPDFLIELATKLKEEKEKNKVLEKKVEADKPKTIFADAVNASETSILIGQLAKLICQNGVQIGQNRLFEKLRNEGYLISQKGRNFNMPTQKSMEMGLFEIKERTINNPDGTIRITKTTLVTGKGQIYFINKFLDR